jgi:hypothetical protein
LALKTYAPSPSSTTGSVSTSYSSRISPTISSSRSSSVTRPAVPPYSSTTIASCLLALELLEQLGHPLGLGHEGRGPDQATARPPASSPLGHELDQILHEDDAEDVVEVVRIHGDPRILLLTEERQQLVERRVAADRDDVRPRRHDLADERVAEVHDRLQQAPAVPFDDALVVA